MPRHFPACEGFIEGLYLPQLAWDVLHREGIQTPISLGLWLAILSTSTASDPLRRGSSDKNLTV